MNEINVIHILIMQYNRVKRMYSTLRAYFKEVFQSMEAFQESHSGKGSAAVQR